MIIRNVNIRIDDNITRSTPRTIVLYEGDNGILLKITIQKFKYDLSEIGRIDASIFNVDTAKQVILTNLQYTDKKEIILPIYENNLVLDQIGKYQIHLHIYDTKLNRISTPIFEIVCKKPINLE